MQLVCDRYSSTTDLHVLLSPATMSSLGVVENGIVKIAARRFILASVSSRQVPAEGEQRIFIPRIFRIALKCALGETVTVSAFNMCKPADQVVLAPVAETTENIKGDFMSLVRESGYDFTNIPLWKDMVIPVYACQHLFEFRVIAAAPISAVVVQNPNVITCDSKRVERGSAPGYSGVSYDDVGGIDEQIMVIRRHVESLRTATILITAPSGCGKTYLSRVIRNETSAHFEYVPCMELLSMPFERGSSMLGKISDSVAQKKPAIVYIDDLDSITNGNLFHEGKRDYRMSQSLGDFIDKLSQMDEIVIFATAKSTEDLGHDFTPPRRFREEIKLTIPGSNQRTQVLKVMTRKMPISSANAFDDITVMTEGKTPSDLLWICEKSLVNQLQNLVAAYDVATRKVDLNQLREIAIGQGQFDRKNMKKKSDSKPKRKAKKGKKKNLDVFDDILKGEEEEDGETPAADDRLFTMGGARSLDQKPDLFCVKDSKTGQFKKKSRRHRKHDVNDPFGKAGHGKSIDPFGVVNDSGENSTSKMDETDDRMSDPFATGRGLNFGMAMKPDNDPFSMAPPKSPMEDQNDPFAMVSKKPAESDDVFALPPKLETPTRKDNMFNTGDDPFALMQRPASSVENPMSSKKSALEEEIFAPSPRSHKPDPFAPSGKTDPFAPHHQKELSNPLPKSPSHDDPFAPKPVTPVQTSASFSGKVIGRSLRDAIHQSPKPTLNDDPFAIKKQSTSSKDDPFAPSHSSSRSTGDPFAPHPTPPRPAGDDGPFSVTPKSTPKPGNDSPFAPSPKPASDQFLGTPKRDDIDPFAPVSTGGETDPFKTRSSSSNIDGPFSATPKSATGDPFAQPQAAADPFAPAGGPFSAAPKTLSSDPFAPTEKEAPKQVEDPFAMKTSSGDPFAATPKHAADPFAVTPKETPKHQDGPFSVTPKEPAKSIADPFAASKPIDDPFAATSKGSQDPFATAPKETPKPSDDPFAVTPKETPKQSNDPFAATPKETPKPSDDPFAITPKETPKPVDDPFAITPKETPKPSDDPFAITPKETPKQSNDPFATTPKETSKPVDDPFAITPKETPKPVDDPFAITPKAESKASQDPFATTPKETSKPVDDPFAITPKDMSKASQDPFATTPKETPNPVDDPFAITSKDTSKGSQDPFATTPKSGSDPFAVPPKQPSDDPFASTPKDQSKPSQDPFGAPPKDAPKPADDPFAPRKPGDDIFSGYKASFSKGDPFAARPAGSPTTTTTTGPNPFSSVMKLRIDDDIFGPSDSNSNSASKRRNPRESVDPFALPPKP